MHLLDWIPSLRQNFCAGRPIFSDYSIYPLPLQSLVIRDQGASRTSRALLFLSYLFLHLDLPNRASSRWQLGKDYCEKSSKRNHSSLLVFIVHWHSQLYQLLRHIQTIWHLLIFSATSPCPNPTITLLNPTTTPFSVHPYQKTGTIRPLSSSASRAAAKPRPRKEIFLLLIKNAGTYSRQSPSRYDVLRDEVLSQNPFFQPEEQSSSNRHHLHRLPPDTTRLSKTHFYSRPSPLTTRGKLMTKQKSIIANATPRPSCQLTSHKRNCSLHFHKKTEDRQCSIWAKWRTRL